MLKKYSSTPYIIWSAIFVVLPLLLVIGFSMIVRDQATGQLVFSIEGYKTFMEPLYIKVLLRSIKIAMEATVLCLLIGYPMAMILANLPDRTQKFAMMFLILPMWMNFLLRTYAWMAILGKNGFINKFLMAINLPTLDLLYNEGAVLLGMVYNFLPFMILPIYTVLIKIDKSIIEAAKDLGANKNTVLRKIIIPLSLPGIISGITMVFMPAVSTFVIPTLLGGGQNMMIGNLIEQQFLVVGNWQFGSSISVILMILILLSMRIMNKYDKVEGGDMRLW